MPKKKKDKKISNKIPHKDAIERMNYLYQIAHEALRLKNESLARFYMYTMMTISKRLVIRLDPSIKRTICKHCHSLLVPGITMRVRVSSNRETHIVQTCLYCKNQKRFLARPNYKLKHESEYESEYESKSSLSQEEFKEIDNIK